MTTHAATICAQPGCWRPATHKGRCRQHQPPTTRRGDTRQLRKLRNQILQRDRHICWICGQPGANSVDHITRLADGGTDNPTNLKAAHLECNIRREKSGGRPVRTGAERSGAAAGSKIRG